MKPGGQIKATAVLESSGPPQPLMALEVADEYLEEQVLGHLKKSVLEPGFEDFNFRRIRCSKGTGAGQLLDALAELPVMVGGRLLVLNDADGLAASAAEAAAAEVQRGLSADVYLVVTQTPSRKKSVNALLDVVKSGGVTVRCEMDAGERIRWLKGRAKALGIKLDKGVPEAMLERIGDNSRLAASQLERLALLVGKGQTVARKQVEDTVPVSATVAMWKLTAAVGKRDLPEANGILERVLAQGEYPGSILSYLNSYLVSLVQIGGLYKQLRSTADVAKAIPRKKEFQVKKTLQELKTWSESDLDQAFENICRADFRMKSGHESKLVLQLLLLQLCKRRGVRRR